MCGLAGLYYPETPKPVDPARIRTMIDAMAARGCGRGGVCGLSRPTRADTEDSGARDPASLARDAARDPRPQPRTRRDGSCRRDRSVHRVRARALPQGRRELARGDGLVDDERDVARELVAKKLRSMHGLDRVVQTRRLSGMLARKGYGHDVARVVITEALDAEPEHQRD